MTPAFVLGAVVMAVIGILGASSAAAEDAPWRLAQRVEEERQSPTTPEERAGREHFQIKVTPGYEQGDYGTDGTTRIFAVPVTLRYLAETWDLSASFSYLRVDSPGNLTFVAGQATPVSDSTGRRRIDEGFGDIVLKGRYYLIEDTGQPGSLPTITPLLRLKLPTAPSPELGTGEPDFGFGVEFDKTFGPALIIFGDVTYTIIGEPDGVNLRNRPGASIGAGYRVSPLITVSGLLDWRRAVSEGQTDPVDLTGFVSFKLTPTFTATPYLTVGLTSGAADVGFGVELSYKFGRY